ncbi:MAG TPA: hypothetical protein VMF51_21430 [Nocardioides sp.]|uniref:hypothetical protein n=1 Tax=Nocardioides sp. TaxID=35761 RepID=UPI002CD1708F|nr:hypothetical protein [Nocardioides sp.]HTW17703.1 hypothetical protein [Nocardioides sp.]
MDDLEQLVRDGLRERAERVDTTAPLVARARQSARRRRGARAVVAAAAAVVIVVGGAAILDGSRDVSPSPAPDVTSDGAETPTPMAPDGWRTEQWHDLAVDVPAHWGYGSAPIRTDRRPTICDDRRPGPYVGRPVMASDMCMFAAWIEPEDPYVWLGADLEPGIVVVGDGLVQETVEVAGTTLTVAADDPLRRRILGSARRGGTCPGELGGVPTARLPIATTGHGLMVCAYRSEDGQPRLVGGELLDAAAARQLIGSYRASALMSRAPECEDAADEEMLLLQVRDRQWVAGLQCQGIREVGEDDWFQPFLTGPDRWEVGVLPHVLAWIFGSPTKSG